MLNWIARYAPVASLLLDARGRLGASVLDVGSGCVGLACVAGDEPFVGVDVAFDGPIAPALHAVRVAPGPLPFEDASFDVVLSLDALEHVPPGDRRGFVAELGRVAARTAIVACPSSEAAWIDDLLRRRFAQRGVPAPAWLHEHAEHGLPTPAEIAAACDLAGFRARPLPQPPGLLAILAAIADTDPDLAAAAREEVSQRSGEWTRVFTAAGGPSFRHGLVLERERPVAARVRRERLWPGALAAMRSPCCGGGLSPTAGGAACGGCGRALAGGAGRALDLESERRPAPATIVEEAV